MAKEALKCGKRDLSIWKKRPVAMSIKRPSYMAKEA
jgi:hypothetical protein